MSNQVLPLDQRILRLPKADGGNGYLPPFNDDPSGRGSRQGKEFEKMCIFLLRCSGWAINERCYRFPDAGVEVDIIATNRQDISVYITCKGSFSGDRPGCKRTDTVKKAIQEAAALHFQGWGPVLLLTSHLPDTESGQTMLANAMPEPLFDAINPLITDKRLVQLASMSEDDLKEDFDSRVRLRAQPRGFKSWQREAG